MQLDKTKRSHEGKRNQECEVGELFLLGERGVDEARPTSGGRVQEGRKETALFSH